MSNKINRTRRISSRHQCDGACTVYRRCVGKVSKYQFTCDAPGHFSYYCEGAIKRMKRYGYSYTKLS